MNRGPGQVCEADRKRPMCRRRTSGNVRRPRKVRREQRWSILPSEPEFCASCDVVHQPGTVWSFLLEQQEADPSTYKLFLELTRFRAEYVADDLTKSVKEELKDRSYIVPRDIYIYRENPFTTEVQNFNRDVIYHLRPGAQTLRANSDDLISDDHRTSKRPFYVLVSKLREQQPAMNIAAAPSTAMQGKAATLRATAFVFFFYRAYLTTALALMLLLLPVDGTSVRPCDVSYHHAGCYSASI